MSIRQRKATRSRGPLPLWALTTCLTVVLVAAVTLGALRGQGTPQAQSTTQLGPLAPRITPERQLPPGPGLPLAPKNQPTPLPTLAQLKTSVTQLEAENDAKLGLAIVPVHRPELPTSPPWHVGSLLTGPAWGTISVPIAVAALDAADNPDELAASLDQAISLSDEDAVTEVWQSLGTPPEASDSVRKELVRGGDPNTQVPTKPPRPGASIPDQTVWALTDQATYISTLACTQPAQPILDRMTQIVPDERWGLGQLPTTAFKGGWGPDAKGNYVVRQVGTLKLTDGSYVGIAMAAQADDGSRTSATELLSDLAHLVDQQAGGFGGGC